MNDDIPYFKMSGSQKTPEANAILLLKVVTLSGIFTITEDGEK